MEGLFEDKCRLPDVLRGGLGVVELLLGPVEYVIHSLGLPELRSVGLHRVEGSLRPAWLSVDNVVFRLQDRL